MDKQKSIKAKPRRYKMAVKNKYNQKSNYFLFDVKDKKWQDIYSFIIKWDYKGCGRRKSEVIK